MAISAVEQQILRLASFIYKAPVMSGGSGTPLTVVESNSDSILTALQTPLNHAGSYDSVRIGDGTSLLAVNADGSVNTFPSSTGVTAVRMEDSGAKDAAGRLRVSNTLVLGEYSNVEAMNSEMFDFTGTGTFSYEDLTDGVTGVKMSVAAGQYCIAETVYSHSYIKGHSQKWNATTQNFQNEAGLVKTIGYYSSSVAAPYTADRDGMYVESDGAGEYYLCLMRKGTVVLRLSRANWDDPLDGTGASGLTIDWSVFNIAECDFLWLGGKGARFNFMIDNNLVEAHNYGHAGAVGGFIMRSPNQPIRFEIRSTTGAGYLYCLCADVTSEGSINTLGVPRAVTLGSTFVNANSIGTGYLIAAVRVNPSKRNSVIDVADFNIAGITTDSFNMQWIKNPTIAGTITWVDYSTTSAIQYALGDTVANPSTTAVTGGQLIKAISTDSRAPSSGGDLVNTLNRLSRKVDGTSDVFALVVYPLSANLDANGNINLLEKIL
ncbi:hypothetical protein KAU11_10735 [Candidatus Babeliales bacterium]|nr:hypothetical protein [Candidatus Babeliales bacterium]